MLFMIQRSMDMFVIILSEFIFSISVKQKLNELMSFEDFFKYMKMPEDLKDS